MSHKGDLERILAQSSISKQQYANDSRELLAAQQNMNDASSSSLSQQCKDPFVFFVDLFNRLPSRVDIAFFEEYNRVMGGSLVPKGQFHKDAVLYGGTDVPPRHNAISAKLNIKAEVKSPLYKDNPLAFNYGQNAFTGSSLKTTQFVGRAQCVGMMRIGYITDGYSKLYYWSGTSFVEMPITASDKQGEFSASQRLVHRVVAFNLTMRGWFIAPCYHLIQPVEDDSTAVRDIDEAADVMLASLDGVIAPYAALSGSAVLLIQTARTSNFIATYEDYCSFWNLVHKSMREKAYAKVGTRQDSGLPVLATLKDVPSGHTVTDAGPDSPLFWAILAYECMEAQDAIESFGSYGVFWKRIIPFERQYQQALEAQQQSTTQK